MSYASREHVPNPDQWAHHACLPVCLGLRDDPNTYTPGRALIHRCSPSQKQGSADVGVSQDTGSSWRKLSSGQPERKLPRKLLKASVRRWHARCVACKQSKRLLRCVGVQSYCLPLTLIRSHFCCYVITPECTHLSFKPSAYKVDPASWQACVIEDQGVQASRFRVGLFH